MLDDVRQFISKHHFARGTVLERPLEAWPEFKSGRLTDEEIAQITGKSKTEIALDRRVALKDYKKILTSSSPTRGSNDQSTYRHTNDAQVCEVKRQQLRNEAVTNNVNTIVRNWDKYPAKRNQKDAIVRAMVTSSYDDQGKVVWHTEIPVVKVNPTMSDAETSEESSSEDEEANQARERERQTQAPTTPTTSSARGWGLGSIVPSAARTVTKFLPSFGRRADSTPESTTQPRRVIATEPKRRQLATSTNDSTPLTSQRKNKAETLKAAALRAKEENARRRKKKEERKELAAEVLRLSKQNKNLSKDLVSAKQDLLQYRPPPPMVSRMAERREAEEKRQAELKEESARKEAEGFARTVETGIPSYYVEDPADKGKKRESTRPVLSIENAANTEGLVDGVDSAEVDKRVDKGKGREKKRKRSLTPEIIPNPPGASFGMHDKYFGPLGSDEESSDDESIASSRTPSKRQRTSGAVDVMSSSKKATSRKSTTPSARRQPTPKPRLPIHPDKNHEYQSWKQCRIAIHQSTDYDIYLGIFGPTELRDEFYPREPVQRNDSEEEEEPETPVPAKKTHGPATTPPIRFTAGGGRIFEVPSPTSTDNTDFDDSYAEPTTPVQAVSALRADTSTPRASEQVSNQTPTPRPQEQVIGQISTPKPTQQSAGQTPASAQNTLQETPKTAPVASSSRIAQQPQPTPRPVQQPASHPATFAEAVALAKQRDQALKYAPRKHSSLQNSYRLSTSTVASDDASEHGEEEAQDDAIAQSIRLPTEIAALPDSPPQEHAALPGPSAESYQLPQDMPALPESPPEQDVALPQPSAESYQARENYPIQEEDGAFSSDNRPSSTTSLDDDQYDPRVAHFQAYEAYKPKMTDRARGLVDSSWNPEVHSNAAYHKMQRELQLFKQQKKQEEEEARASGQSTAPTASAVAPAQFSLPPGPTTQASSLSGPSQQHAPVVQTSSFSDPSIDPVLTGDVARFSPRVNEFIDQNWTEERSVQAGEDFAAEFAAFKAARTVPAA
ncbi:uncharacterized protein KY384_007275 [Bacidia gigantensis]|uniref:uncharacterized protein n=1 Tax=Bacidia gigantensis TaxID=2732470 RepID=UPI001D05130B|nr:uncharacterized protein KY384_007275 [Bacidia gigantensis]KAG8528357.1 hypothetical protein KY384_007275 [Bacidia gigantensis]